MHNRALRSRLLALARCVVIALLALAISPPLASAAQEIEVTVRQLTGTRPFDAAAGPGRDTSESNDIVRSNDTVQYDITFSVNETGGVAGVAENVTIEQTLPSGMAWTRLPDVCVTPGSAIVGQTLTCLVGDITTGSARTLSLIARVTEMRHDTVITPAADSITVRADTAARAASTTPGAIRVSSVPRVDMVKQTPTVTYVASGGRDGVPGYLINYPLSVRVPDFGGRGLIGYAPPDAEMSFVDDYANISPNAEFVECRGASRGTWRCTEGGGKTVDIEVVVTDPTVLPTTSPGNLSSATIVFFLPESDLRAAGSLTTHNILRDLEATGSGGSVPAEGEILSNNEIRFALSDRASGTFYKHYVDFTNTGNYVPGGPNVDRNGYAVVSPDQIFQAEVRVTSTNLVRGFESVATCDVFDTVTQEVTTDGAAAARYGGAPAWIVTASSQDGPFRAGEHFVLEYSTKPTSTDPDPATRWAALRATDCGDDDPDEWSATPPSDVSRITKVRVRTIGTPPNRFTLYFAVNLRAKHGANGTVIANFMQYLAVTDPAEPTWVQSAYNPATHTGTRGDRLLLGEVQTRIAKHILDPAVGPSTTPTVRAEDGPLHFQLEAWTLPSPTGMTVTARDTIVVDVLPAGTRLSDDPALAPSPRPSSVIANPDGTTTITWDLGDLSSDERVRIDYWVELARTAVGNLVNRAIINSPDDIGSIDPDAIPTTGTDPHFAARTINVVVLAGIQIDKTLRRNVIEPGDDLVYDITYANLYLTAVDDLQTIDVLPFIGDRDAHGNVPGRNPGSDFHGGYTLEEVVVSNGETVELTDADPALVLPRTDHTRAGHGTFGDLPAGRAWCTEDQIARGEAGCPASLDDVTAVRVTRNGAMDPLSSAMFTIRLRTHGNRSGDVYANGASLRAPSLELGTLSPFPAARVVASQIGDLVWNDRNGNGVQDPGEEGVEGVRVTLTGTNKHGELVSVTTTTGPDGRYLFTGTNQDDQTAGGYLTLVSGEYKVTFDPASLPPRASFTRRYAGAADEDSDADETTGESGLFTLPDPTPTGDDGEDLTLDAGIVIAPEPPAPPTPDRPRQPDGTDPNRPQPDEPRAAPARIVVKKIAGRKTVRAGDKVTYRIQVRNIGGSTARRVVVCDRVPSQLTVVSYTRGGRFRSGAVCWTVTLRAGAKRVLKIVTRVDRDARGRVRNVVTVEGAPAQVVLPQRRAVAVVRVKPVRAVRGVSRVTG